MEARHVKKHSITDDRRFINRIEAYWRPRHHAVEERISFLLDGEHFDDGDESELARDRRLARFVGQESFHAHRHELASVTKSGSSVQARPVDEEGDPDSAEQAVALAEAEVENPQKCWEEAVEDAISCASAAGYGYAAIEFLPDEGLYGELSYFGGDPRDFMWDPRGRGSIHNAGCRWVCIRRRLTRAQCESMRGWKKSVVKQMRPDGGYAAEHSRREAGPSPRVSGRGPEAEWTDEDEHTVYFLYRRGEGPAKRPVSGSLRVLPEGKRYMHCQSCDWDSPTEEQIGAPLPDESVCGQCGGRAERADSEEEQRAIWGYPDIKLSILAPYSGVDEYLYDDVAPIPARSFPFFHIVRNRHPLEPYGMSLTDLNWWNQLSADLIMTLAIERLLASAPVLSMPEDGISDAQGERWQSTDENGHVMFRDAGVGVGDVQLIEGDGVPASWSPVYQAARNALTSHMGIADFGMGPEQSHDIAAASVEKQIAQQEIPTAHYERRIQREKARWLGITYDHIRATYPDERVARLRGKDGADAVAALNAADMPNFDFVFMDAPDFTAMDEAKIRGFQQLMQMAIDAPEMFEIMASAQKVPPSMVRKMREAAAAQAQRLAQMAAAQPVPGGNPGATAPGAAPAAEMMGAGEEPFDVDAFLSQFMEPEEAAADF